MKPSIFLRFTLIALAVLVWYGPARADDAPIAVLRAASLDSLTSDIDRMSGLFGAEVGGATWVTGFLGDLGISDVSWIDGSRPLALAVPLSGITLGTQGIVGAFPTRDARAAIGALDAGFSAVEEEDDGVLRFDDEQGNARLWARIVEGHIVASPQRRLALGFDPTTAIDGRDLPPNSLSLDVHLEAVAGMLVLALEAGKQMALQQLLQSAAPDGDGPDPAALTGMVDMYVVALRDLIHNTSRLQLSLEMSSDNLIVHKRIVPRPGSTLAGFLEVQKGGLPELARHIDTQGAWITAAGQVTHTPAFLEALAGYYEAYRSNLIGLQQLLPGESGSEWMSVAMTALPESTELWTDCYRGDFATTYATAEGGGLGIVQMFGAKDADACDEVLAAMGRAIADAPAGPDGERLMTFTENALEYRGVRAGHHETNVGSIAAADADPDTRNAVRAVFGGDSVSTYTGRTKDLVLSTTGKNAEQSFKDVVDRVSKKKKKKKGNRGSLKESAFEPLRVGPGAFGAIDLGPLLSTFLEDPPESDGWIVVGARLESGWLDIELALPLAWIETVATDDGSEP